MAVRSNQRCEIVGIKMSWAAVIRTREGTAGSKIIKVPLGVGIGVDKGVGVGGRGQGDGRKKQLHFDDYCCEEYSTVLRERLIDL